MKHGSWFYHQSQALGGATFHKRSVKQDSNSLTLSTVRFYQDGKGCYSLPLEDYCGCSTRLLTLLEYRPSLRMVVILSVDISIGIATAIQLLFKRSKRLLLTHLFI